MSIIPRRGLIPLRHFRLSQRFLSELTPSIRDILENPPIPNSTVTAHGHIKSIRTFKNVGFIDISDGSISQTLNVTIPDPEKFVAENDYKIGQSVAISGQWVESKGTQKYELQYICDHPRHLIRLFGDVPDDYPMQKKAHSLLFLRTTPTLRHRTATLSSILRFRSHIEQLVMKFFSQRGFTKVSPPLITSSDCEGAGEMFSVAPLGKAEAPGEQFFGQDAFLTVSTQLHLEVLALSLNRVWTLSPCFRAEQSNTNRHLSEFWMLEAELCYVRDVSQLTKFVEEMIRLLASDLKNEQEQVGGMADLINSRYSSKERQLIQERCDTILSANSWPSITYTEAIDIINRVKNKGKLKNRLAWGSSILTEHEKWLAGTYFQSPVFITDYPKEQKPFYMPRSHESVYDPQYPTVACFDLIVPEIGELVGGSIRQHLYDELLEEIEQRGMNAESMQWYLSLRENGSVPHGGFGMGFERLIAYLSAMENIKDVSAFPRAPQVCPC